MERKIYLIRHCEPELPRGVPVCIGKMDIPLSEKGIKQAIELKKYFSNINLTGVYSSPLSRALETAKIISDNRFKVKIRDNFSELNIGKWDGMSFEEIKKKYSKEYKERGENLEHYIVEGGESMAMCRDRAFGELSKTIDESEGNIVIVTHAGVNRTIFSKILDISIKESFKYKHEYGSVNILLYNREVLKINRIGKKVSELEC